MHMAQNSWFAVGWRASGCLDLAPLVSPKGPAHPAPSFPLGALHPVGSYTCSPLGTADFHLEQVKKAEVDMLCHDVVFLSLVTPLTLLTVYI